MPLGQHTDTPRDLASAIFRPGEQFVTIGTRGYVGTTTVSLALAELLASQRERVLWAETTSVAVPRAAALLGIEGKGTLAAAAMAHLRGQNPATVCERTASGLHTLVGARRDEYAPPDGIIAQTLNAVLPQWTASVIDAGIGPRLVATSEGLRVANVVSSVPPLIRPGAVWIVVTGSSRADLSVAATVLDVLAGAHINPREQVGLVVNEMTRPDRGGRAARTALSARVAAQVTLPKKRSLEDPAEVNQSVTTMHALTDLALIADQNAKSSPKGNDS